jgi:nitrate/nitrite transporter NarK
VVLRGKLRKYHPITAKQAVLILAIAALLWIPMTLFIIYFSNDFSPRQMGLVGAVNMLICVPTLILLYRNWISKMR